MQKRRFAVQIVFDLPQEVVAIDQVDPDVLLIEEGAFLRGAAFPVGDEGRDIAAPGEIGQIVDGGRLNIVDPDIAEAVGERSNKRSVLGWSVLG